MLKPTPSKPGLFSVALKQFSRFKGIAVSALIALVLSVLYLVSATPLVASAATNNSLNFQARLESASGAIVPDGNYDVTFHLFNAASSAGGTDTACTGDTNCLWEESYTYNSGSGGTDARIHVANGYLTVNLGSLTSFPTTINWDQQLWLTMDIGGTTGSGTITWDGQMNPRLQLTAVPYALRAGQLAQYNAATGFTATLGITNPTVGNQTFLLPDMAAAGTYTLLTNGNAIQLQATTPGTQQTGYFNISGTGLLGALDATGTTLAIGATNATTITVGNSSTSTQTINIGSVGTTATASNINIGTTSDTTHTQTIKIGSTTQLANSTTISGGGTGGVTIKTGNGGTVSINDTSGGSTTVNIGAVTNDSANTVNIDSKTGGSAVKAVNIGSSDSTSTTNILGGSGTGVSVQAASGGTIAIGTSNNNSVNIGTAAVAGTITVGGSSQTGTITLGQSTATNTISIGGAVGAGNTQTISIGTSATGTTSITLGSSTVGSTTTIQDATTINNAGIPLTLNMTSTGKENGILFKNTGSVNTGEIGITGNAGQITNQSASGDLGIKSMTGSIMFASGGNNDVAKISNSTSSTFAVQNYNTSADPVFNVGTAVSSLVANPSFEANTTNWSPTGGSTLSQNTTASNAYYGNDSLAVALASSGTSGATTSTYTSTLSAGTYSLSFEAKGSVALSGLTASLGSGTCTLSSTSVSITYSWYFCQGVVTTSAPVITITSTSNSATLYIDAVELDQASATSAYRDGNTAIEGNLMVNGSQVQASSSQFALTVNELENMNASGGGGILIQGNSDNLFQNALVVATKAGTDILAVNTTVSSTTITGGSQFWNTPALKVATNDLHQQALVLLGASGQSGDILDIDNNSSGVLANFDSSGNLDIGGKPTGSDIPRTFLQQSTNDIFHGLELANVANTRNLYMWIDGSSNSRIDSGSSGGANLIINAGNAGGGQGLVGIGTVNPGARLQISTDSSGTAGELIQGAIGQTSDLLDLDVNSVAEFTVASSGATDISTTNSAALKIQQASGGTTVLNVNSAAASGGTSGAHLNVSWLSGDTDLSTPTTYFGSSSSSDNQIAVYAQNNGTGTSCSTYIFNNACPAILGQSVNGNGIRGVSSASVGVVGISTSSLGVYGFSSTSVGVFGASDSSNSGLFQADASTNTTPTLVTQQQGSGTANLFQAQNSAGATLLNITKSGDLNVGNASNVSSSGRLFSDSFESGNFSLWSDGKTQSGSSTVATNTTAPVRNGTYDAKFVTVSGGTNYLSTSIPTQTTAMAMAYIYIPSNPTANTRLFGFGDAAGKFYTAVVTTNGAAQAFDSNSGDSVTSGSGVVTTGAWHEFELDVTAGTGGTGSMTLYMDGINEATKSNFTTISSLTQFVVGNTGTSAAGTFYIDDVAADTVRPGDSASLSVSDSLHVSGTSSFGNNLLIQPASNSTTAFQVLNVAGANLLSVDAVNNTVTMLQNAQVSTSSAGACGTNSNLEVADSLTSPTNAVRWRTNACGANLESSGVDMYISGWTDASFGGAGGTQQYFLRGYIGSAANAYADSGLFVGNAAASTSPMLLVLANKSTAGDPAFEFDGGMYYNSKTESFQCGQNGNWEDCTGLVEASTSVVGPKNGCSGGTCSELAFGQTWTALQNDCYQGVVYHITATGHATSTTAGYTLNFNLQDKNVTTGTTSDITTGGVHIGTDSTWTLDLYLTCGSTSGESGQLAGSLISQYAGGNLGGNVGVFPQSSFSLSNSAGGDQLGLSVQWASGSAPGSGNGAYETQFIVQRLGAP